MITGLPFLIIIIILIITSIACSIIGYDNRNNKLKIPAICGIVIFGIIGIIGWIESYNFNYMPTNVVRVKVDKSAVAGQNFGYVDCKDFKFSIPLIQTNLPLGYNKSGGRIVYTFYDKDVAMPDSLYVYKLEYMANSNIFLKSNKKQFEIVDQPKVDYELCIKMSGNDPLRQEELAK